MKNLMIVGAALAVGTLAGSAAMAESFKKFGSEGGWDIMINKDMGPGCLMIGKGPDGEQIQMGINATAADRRGYIAIYTKADAGVAADQEIPTKFDIDGEVFEGTFKGQQIDGFDGAFVQVNNPDFVNDVVERKMMTITPEGRPALVVDLSGTAAAQAAMLACQKAQ